MPSRPNLLQLLCCVIQQTTSPVNRIQRRCIIIIKMIKHPFHSYRCLRFQPHLQPRYVVATYVHSLHARRHWLEPVPTWSSSSSKSFHPVMIVHHLTVPQQEVDAIKTESPPAAVLRDSTDHLPCQSNPASMHHHQDDQTSLLPLSLSAFSTPSTTEVCHSHICTLSPCSTPLAVTRANMIIQLIQLAKQSWSKIWWLPCRPFLASNHWQPTLNRWYNEGAQNCHVDCDMHSNM